METTGLSLGRVIERFDIEFLEEAAAFLNTLPAKTKDKVLYNMQKARVLNDPELFKKVNEHIWEFRTHYDGAQLRFLAFWVQRGGQRALILATHGFTKKTSRVPDREIAHALQLRLQYLKGT